MADTDSADGDVDHTVRLQDDGPPSWSDATGYRASRDDPLISGLSKDEADSLVENGPFDHVAVDDPSANSADESDAEAEADATETLEPPLDPSEYTLDELESELESGDFSNDDLDSILNAERSGKDRSGAIDRIEASRSNSGSE